MTYPFNALAGLIIVETELEGPAKVLSLRLALDTGSMGTLIDVNLLVAAGYVPAAAPSQVQMVTASGSASAPRLPVDRLRALGQERHSFPVVAYSLPPGASIDGLLGLDFLRGLKLTIDFHAGQIDLT